MKFHPYRQFLNSLSPKIKRNKMSLSLNVMDKSIHQVILHQSSGGSGGSGGSQYFASCYINKICPNLVIRPKVGAIPSNITIYSGCEMRGGKIFTAFNNFVCDATYRNCVFDRNIWWIQA